MSRTSLQSFCHTRNSNAVYKVACVAKKHFKMPHKPRAPHLEAILVLADRDFAVIFISGGALVVALAGALGLSILRVP